MSKYLYSKLSYLQFFNLVPLLVTAVRVYLHECTFRASCVRALGQETGESKSWCMAIHIFTVFTHKKYQKYLWLLSPEV